MEQNKLTDLKQSISGCSYELAQTLIGLVPNDGRDREKHQRCPIPSCSSLHDGFRYNADTGKFHCRKCEFGGDLRRLRSCAKQSRRG